MAKVKISKERLKEYAYDKAKFDRVARRRMCMRCGARVVTEKVTSKVSTPIAVISHSFWLCADCGRGLSRYVSEIRDAKREAERPQREAEQAERKQAVADTLARNRANANAQRAAGGLPPLPDSRPKDGRKIPGQTDLPRN